MSKLSERLTAKNNTVSVQQSMYSPEGAAFQEWALSILDYKGSEAHKSIGRLVTAINNCQMSIGQAEDAYLSLRKQS